MSNPQSSSSGDGEDAYYRQHGYNDTPANAEAESRSAQAARVTMITQLQLRNPLLTFLFHFIYNLAPIVATIVVLTKYTDNFNGCQYPINVFSIGLCVKNVWRLGFQTYKYRLTRVWSRMRGLDIYERVANDLAALTRWERIDRYLDLVLMIWFIIGSFWIFRESVCDFSDPSYRLAFGLLMIVWIEVLAPCLIICTLLPFVICCPVFLLRILRLVSVEPEGAQQGASTEQVNKLSEMKYVRPEGTDVQCSICLTELETDDDVRVLPCRGQHTYHKECIDQWLVVNGICCICRDKIFDVPADTDAAANVGQQPEREAQDSDRNRNVNDHVQPNPPRQGLAAETAHMRAQRFNIPIADNNDNMV